MIVVLISVCGLIIFITLLLSLYFNWIDAKDFDITFYGEMNVTVSALCSSSGTMYIYIFKTDPLFILGLTSVAFMGKNLFHAFRYPNMMVVFQGRKYIYKVKKSYLTYVSKSYSDVKEMVINQLLLSFPNFKLKNKTDKLFQNYKKEPFALDSKILVANRPNEFILGLTFFHTSGTTYVTNYINRVKDEQDYALEEQEKLEREQEIIALEEERKEHERLIRLEEEQAAIRLEEDRLRIKKEEANKLEVIRLQKQKKNDDFPPLGGKPK